MFRLAEGLAAPMLLLLPPEEAHELTLRALEAGLHAGGRRDDPRLAVRIAGLHFPNPLSVAAGFDKDARVPDALLALGCGFAEVGTVTPEPQTGSPRPRVFRLPDDRAVINRLGFNNGGHGAALARLEKRGRRGIVGVNIGANRESHDRIGDYVRGVETFARVASYFMVNISSPNTPGLRQLEQPSALDDLMTRVIAARDEAAARGAPKRPVLVKLSPDLGEADVEPVTARLAAHGVDGIAMSNTTLDRRGLSDPNRRQGGGLSGRPLFHRATVMLARVHRATGGRIPLIGIGGIDSPSSALAKIEAGASLIQLYTGLIYEGPGLIQRIKDHLALAARRAGVPSIQDLSGCTAAEWAEKPLE